VQLYRYFVSQSSEFCRHNPLCCFSTSVYYYCCCLFCYQLSPETFGYTITYQRWSSHEVYFSDEMIVAAIQKPPKGVSFIMK